MMEKTMYKIPLDVTKIGFSYQGGMNMGHGAERWYQGKIGEVVIKYNIWTPKIKIDKAPPYVTKWGKQENFYSIGNEKKHWKTLKGFERELLKRGLVKQLSQKPKK